MTTTRQGHPQPYATSTRKHARRCTAADQPSPLLVVAITAMVLCVACADPTPVNEDAAVEVHAHDTADSGADVPIDQVDDAPDADGADAKEPEPICPAIKSVVSGGQDVPFCEEAYPERPFLRIPDDTDTTVFATLREGEWITRDGPLSAQVPQAMTLAESGLAGAHGDRYAYAIYRVSLAGSSVTAVTPAVIIDDRLMLGPLAGATFQGVISRRISADMFEWPPTLPVAVRLDSTLTLTDAPDSLHGYPIHTLGATIVNRSEGVALDDGGCIPALASSDDAPFSGTSNPSLDFSRIPNMHGGFDDVLVVTFDALGTSNMGTGGYISPIDLLSDTPLPSIRYESEPHGAPGYGPALYLYEEPLGGPCVP